MSETTKHTPGPYRVYTFSGRQFVKGPKDQTLAELRPTFSGRELPIDANARLFAAAPEMLDALKTMTRLFWTCISDGNGELDGDKEAIAQARAIIAKAEGE